MINQEALKGNWNHFKGVIRQKWGQLSDNDVAEFEGNVDELIGMIQQKTGEGREAVEKYLQDLTEGGGAAISQLAETARQYVQGATQSIQGSARHAADQVNQGLAGATCCVREHPAKSLAICFGAGVLAGAALAWLLRAK
jgi:uncharacterized protein YjbJ (UPF0337 family)